MEVNLVEEIKKQIGEFAEKIDLAENSLSQLWIENDFASPYIKIDDSGYMHLIVRERGQISEDKIAKDINQLLYWIFSGITFSMACSFELKNRIESQDCRRMIFTKQNELLKKLNIDWSEKEIKSQEAILKNYPFDDLAGLRASYFRELRNKGYSENDIEILAYKKYPEN
jgi:Immunity protein 63